MSNTSVLVSVYQSANQEIEFCKNQQWKVLYYSIVAYSALFGVFVLTKSEWIPISIGIIIFVVATKLSWNLNKAINHSRQILGEIQASVPLIFRISNPVTKLDMADCYENDLQSLLKEEDHLVYRKEIKQSIFQEDNKFLRKFGYFGFLSLFSIAGLVIMSFTILNYVK